MAYAEGMLSLRKNNDLDAQKAEAEVKTRLDQAWRWCLLVVALF